MSKKKTKKKQKTKNKKTKRQNVVYAWMRIQLQNVLKLQTKEFCLHYSPCPTHLQPRYIINLNSEIKQAGWKYAWKFKQQKIQKKKRVTIKLMKRTNFYCVHKKKMFAVQGGLAWCFRSNVENTFKDLYFLNI